MVGCLPKTYSDRERRQLMSSSMGQFLFDGQTLAVVEQREQDSSQRALVSQIARGLPLLAVVPELDPGVLKSHADSLGHPLSVEFAGLGSQVLPRLWRLGEPPVSSASTVEVGGGTGATAVTQVCDMSLPSSVGNSLPNGDSVVRPGVNDRGGADGFLRPQSRVVSGANPCSVLQVSSSMLRPCLCTSGFYQGDGSRFGLDPSLWHSFAPLSGELGSLNPPRCRLELSAPLGVRGKAPLPWCFLVLPWLKMSAENRWYVPCGTSMQLRHKGSASSVFPAGNSSQLGQVQFSPQPEEAVSQNGVGFSESPSFSISRSCQPLARGGPTLPFAQSSTSSPVEVLTGSSGVLREAGSRRQLMGAFSSMVSEDSRRLLSTQTGGGWLPIASVLRT